MSEKAFKILFISLAIYIIISPIGSMYFGYTVNKKQDISYRDNMLVLKTIQRCVASQCAKCQRWYANRETSFVRYNEGGKVKRIIMCVSCQEQIAAQQILAREEARKKAAAEKTKVKTKKEKEKKEDGK